MIMVAIWIVFGIGYGQSSAPTGSASSTSNNETQNISETISAPFSTLTYENSTFGFKISDPKD
jgi:hypothetical protein